MLRNTTPGHFLRQHMMNDKGRQTSNLPTEITTPPLKTRENPKRDHGQVGQGYEQNRYRVYSAERVRAIW